jgi:selenocysteine lyase/cysteine desulfurase
MQLDLEFIRQNFPAFDVPSLQGQSFFENAGGSYTCVQVQDRLARFYRERKVQPYAPYQASRLGGAEMDEARARLAAMLGVESDELSFGPSTTQNTYVLAQAVGQWLEPGQSIIVTNQDHEANSGPWRRLAERGIEVKEWCVDPQTGLLDPQDLQALLDGSVRMVCFPHCSNVIAAVNPVAEITALIRAAGAYSCVDGVSYAPHGFVNVSELGADIYLFSAYKTYGPHQGLMVIGVTLECACPIKGIILTPIASISVLPPPVLITLRWRPVRVWPIIWMRFMRITFQRKRRRQSGQQRSMICFEIMRLVWRNLFWTISAQKILCS